MVVTRPLRPTDLGVMLHEARRRRRGAHKTAEATTVKEPTVDSMGSHGTSIYHASLLKRTLTEAKYNVLTPKSGSLT